MVVIVIVVVIYRNQTTGQRWIMMEMMDQTAIRSRTAMRVITFALINTLLNHVVLILIRNTLSQPLITIFKYCICHYLAVWWIPWWCPSRSIWNQNMSAWWSVSSEYYKYEVLVFVFRRDSLPTVSQLRWVEQVRHLVDYCVVVVEHGIPFEWIYSDTIAST